MGELILIKINLCKPTPKKMEIFSTNNLYIGYDDDKFCDFSIHIGNLLIEYQCPATKPNGTIQKDDRSGDGKTLESDGTVQEP